MEVKAWSAFIHQTKAQFGAPFLSTPLPRPAIIAETLTEGEKSSQPERDRLQGQQSRDNKGHLAYLPYSTLRRVVHISSCCSGSCDGRARARAPSSSSPSSLPDQLIPLIAPPPPQLTHGKAAARVLDTIYGYKKTANGVLKGKRKGEGCNWFEVERRFSRLREFPKL